LGKAPVLLERRRVSNLARANERIERTVKPRNASVRAVKLLLQDDVVVTIAYFQGCDARLAASHL
jgi:hypothetical protein